MFITTLMSKYCAFIAQYLDINIVILRIGRQSYATTRGAL